MYGRYSVLDAVSIDLRDMKTVTVSPDRDTVNVGSGATMLHVLEALEPHRVTVSTGTCGTVGFVG